MAESNLAFLQKWSRLFDCLERVFWGIVNCNCGQPIHRQNSLFLPVSWKSRLLTRRKGILVPKKRKIKVVDERSIEKSCHFVAANYTQVPRRYRIGVPKEVWWVTAFMTEHFPTAIRGEMLEPMAVAAKTQAVWLDKIHRL